MRTLKYWLNTLPEPYAEMAIKETDEGLLVATDISLSEAIAGAFGWDTSSMGFDFWEGVHDNAKFIEQQP